MPPKKGGKKGKRGKKRVNVNPTIPRADKDSLLYGQIKKKLGDRRFNINCSDSIDRQGRVCGKMRKRVWVNDGDIVLVSTRECNTIDNYCDIIYKYTTDEAKQLERNGEIDFKAVETDKHQSTIVFDTVDYDAGEKIKPSKEDKLTKYNEDDVFEIEGKRYVEINGDYYILSDDGSDGDSNDDSDDDSDDNSDDDSNDDSEESNSDDSESEDIHEYKKNMSSNKVVRNTRTAAMMLKTDNINIDDI